MKKIVLVVLCLVLTFACKVMATSLTIDEIVYQTATGLDPTKLSGTADATFSGGFLIINLANTSANLGDVPSANMLLTGIGFNLPDGVAITGGFVTYPLSSVVVGYGSSIPRNNVSGEWGWDGSRSPFLAGAYLMLGSVNANVATLQSSTTNKFSNTPVAAPAVLDGPEWGLLSQTHGAFSGLTAIEDTITIWLRLSGTYGGNLIQFIDDREVAIAFGSPNASNPNPVPEPSTMFLLGSGLIGLAGYGRKKFFKK